MNRQILAEVRHRFALTKASDGLPPGPEAFVDLTNGDLALARRLSAAAASGDDDAAIALAAVLSSPDPEEQP